MSAIKKEIQEYINVLPDSTLYALKPLLLKLLIAEKPVIETDLTKEEKAIILRCREEYSKGGYIPLAELDNN